MTRIFCDIRIRLQLRYKKTNSSPAAKNRERYVRDCNDTFLNCFNQSSISSDVAWHEDLSLCFPCRVGNGYLSENHSSSVLSVQGFLSSSFQLLLVQLTFQSILKMVFSSNGKHHFLLHIKPFTPCPLYSKFHPTLPSAGRSSEQNQGTYADALLAPMKRWALSFTKRIILSWNSVLLLHTPRL